MDPFFAPKASLSSNHQLFLNKSVHESGVEILAPKDGEASSQFASPGSNEIEYRQRSRGL